MRESETVPGLVDQTSSFISSEHNLPDRASPTICRAGRPRELSLLNPQRRHCLDHCPTTPPGMPLRERENHDSPSLSQEEAESEEEEEEAAEQASPTEEAQSPPKAKLSLARGASDKFLVSAKSLGKKKLKLPEREPWSVQLVSFFVLRSIFCRCCGCCCGCHVVIVCAASRSLCERCVENGSERRQKKLADTLVVVFSFLEQLLADGVLAVLIRARGQLSLYLALVF